MEIDSETQATEVQIKTTDDIYFNGTMFQHLFYVSSNS
jgi:hypothetical protein